MTGSVRCSSHKVALHLAMLIFQEPLNSVDFNFFETDPYRWIAGDSVLYNAITGDVTITIRDFVPLPAPIITSVSPPSGTDAGGTAVTITGSNFQDGATVEFDNTTATSIVFVSSTTLTAVTPAHSAGAVDIEITNPDDLTATLTNGFTFNPSSPVISSILPVSGPIAGGTDVTITGTNFQSGATVEFDNTTATSIVFVSSTTLAAVTPAHSAGAVTVRVRNPDNVSDALSSGLHLLPRQYRLL